MAAEEGGGSEDSGTGVGTVSGTAFLSRSLPELVSDDVSAALPSCACADAGERAEAADEGDGEAEEAAERALDGDVASGFPFIADPLGFALMCARIISSAAGSTQYSSAVLPFLSLIVGSPFALSNSSISATRPLAAAQCNGVVPSSKFNAFGLARAVRSVCAATQLRVAICETY